jgi:filamentous hemagglutinin
MINFVESPYVKSKYGDLRNQTIAKLESNPDLLITYFDSLAYKFNAKDRSILNRYIKPTLEAGGGAIGGVGSIGGAAYACGASAGIGCYAAVVAGSAGLSSSSDHLITGTKNFGKPLSQQDPTQIVQTLKGLGLSDEAAQTLQLGIDVLGTGGVGFGVGTVAKSGKYVPTAQVIPNNFNLYAGRTLIYHDNIGGHAVAKHVGKSDQQLIARLSAEPRLGATSTFSDLYTAERAIGDTLRLNQTKVNEWLKLSSGPDRLVLPQSLGYNVGRVISRGATKSTNSQKVRLIIDKDPKAPKGFVIITSYPSQ